MAERIDVERIMREIRGQPSPAPAADARPPAEPRPTIRAAELRSALAELHSCVDLYESHGLPPTRLWIPWPLRGFLARVFRYVVNWQVHWNLVAARTLDEMLRVVERVERRIEDRLSGAIRRIEALEPAPAALARRARYERAYPRFEERCRGSEEEVRRRVEVHARTLADVFGAEPSLLGEDGFVLDLGCGRGELLEALRAAGVPCRGVDASPEMIATCRAKGLEVVEDDLFAHLESLPDASLAGATCCQVVEHLGLDDLLRFAERLAAKMRPGSQAIIETVNPENLIASAHTFHLDLTHRQKIPAPALAHVLETFGFEVLDTRYLNSAPPEQQLAPLPDDGAGARAANENFQRLNHFLFGARDYAIVCRRRTAPGA
jgi:2-polyprenyl-3-methyl-5-hydroxy-6-metoxy-1,4-benzoquinol methylase